MKTENFSVSLAMMNYFYQDEYSSLVSNSTYSYFSSYCSLNNSAFGNDELPLDEQKIVGADTESATRLCYDSIVIDNIEDYAGKTWHDYFLDRAVDKAKTMLSFCEVAKERGIELTAEEKAEVKEAAANLVKQINSSTVSSPSGSGLGVETSSEIKLKVIYSGVVTESDIASALGLMTLAAKATTAIAEDSLNSVTLAMIDEEYAKNPKNYDLVDFVNYTFSFDGDPHEREAAEAAAEKLSKATSEKKFFEILLSGILDERYDKTYESVAEEKLYDGATLPSDNNIEIISRKMKKKLLEDVLDDAKAEEFVDIIESANKSSSSSPSYVTDSIVNYPSSFGTSDGSTVQALPGLVEEYIEEIKGNGFVITKTEVAEKDDNASSANKDYYAVQGSVENGQSVNISIGNGQIIGGSVISSGSISTIVPQDNNAEKEKPDYMHFCDIVDNGNRGFSAYGRSVSKEYGEFLTELKAELFLQLYKVKSSCIYKEKSYSAPAEGESESEEYAWLFDESRAAGDVTVITKGGGDEDNTSGDISVYLMLAPRYRNEEKVRDGAFMAFATKEEAKKAIEALDTKGSIDLDSFLEVAADVKTSTSGELDDYAKGGMASDDFDEWFFYESRAKGDYTKHPIAINSTSFIVAYFEKVDELSVWQTDVKYDLYNAKYEDAYAGFVEKYGKTVTTDTELLAKVGG